MSAYENVVGGRLRLKGKALNVKSDGIAKKKKKHSFKYHNRSDQPQTGGNTASLIELVEDITKMDKHHKHDEHGQETKRNDHLTPAEKRYLEQWEKIDLRRMAKVASKSHRDRVHEFNQYLANLTEHYDIPKVGPG